MSDTDPAHRADLVRAIESQKRAARSCVPLGLGNWSEGFVAALDWVLGRLNAPLYEPHPYIEAQKGNVSWADEVVTPAPRPLPVDEDGNPQRCYVHTFVTIDKCGCPPDPTLLHNDGCSGVNSSQNEDTP